MNAVTIRAAALADADGLGGLMQSYWAFERIAGFDRVNACRQLEMFLSTPSLGRGWLAELDGTAIGYLICPFIYSFERRGLMAEIDEFFVEAAMRSRGVGRALLQAARSSLVESGCVALQMQVAADNQAAQRFYSRLGFEPAPKYQIWVAPLRAQG